VRRISLCTIARDEEQLLPACLASVKDAVDEMVVVDTGSQDATVAVATEAGAVVVHHLWRDDPAAARNAALDAASSDWILVLDADEALAPGAAATLREAITSETLVCGLLPVIESDSLEASMEDVLQGTAEMGVPTYLPRLFRRVDDLHWVDGTQQPLAGWLEKHAARTRRIAAPIVHYGWARDRNLGEDESGDIRALQKEVQRQPQEWLSRAHLAEALFDQNQVEDASAEIDISWTLLQTAWRLRHNQTSTPRGTTKVSHLRAAVQLHCGEYAEALETLREARRMGAIHPNLDYLHALAHEQLARWALHPSARQDHLANARERFVAAISQHGRSYAEPLQHGVTSWSAGTRLGTILLQEGQLERARRCFQAAAQRSPDPLDAILGLAEALLELDRPQEALDALKPYLDQETADGWLLAADAYLRLNLLLEFRHSLSEAWNLADTNLRSLHRMERLEGLVETPKAG
jgi:tetratricopeptide (TPR) repeat protein